MKIMDRFIRTERLLGEVCFQNLQRKKVTVVGLGAVGGYAVEGLVRAGVNRLTIVDFDTIQPSNLNRQILALEATIGRPKAEVAKKRVLAINSECRIEALQLFAGDDTLEQILEPQPDLLIDATPRDRTGGSRSSAPPPPGPPRAGRASAESRGPAAAVVG